MADVVPLKHKDGSAHFQCIGCGAEVHRFVGEGPPKCLSCQFIEGLPPAEADALRIQFPHAFGDAAE